MKTSIIIRTGIAALLALALRTEATAADLPSRTYVSTQVYAIAPTFTWTGFYVGANAGYVMNSTVDYVHQNNSNFGGRGGTYSNDIDGGTLGAHAGYNYQMGMFVLGIEGSAQFANVSGNYDFSIYNNNTTTKVSSLFTITPRIGISVFNDSTLLYVKGGWAGANVEAGQVYAPKRGIGAVWGNGAFQSGWTLGLGVDYALTQHIIIGAEYNFIRLNEKTHSGIDSTGTLTQISAKPDMQQVRLNVSYKF